MGSGEEVGLARIAAGIDRVLSERPGQHGYGVAGNHSRPGNVPVLCLRAYRDVIGAVSAQNRPRVAVCWDTCHIFAAGIDFTDEYKYERMVEVVRPHRGP